MKQIITFIYILIFCISCTKKFVRLNEDEMKALGIIKSFVLVFPSGIDFKVNQARIGSGSGTTFITDIANLKEVTKAYGRGLENGLHEIGLNESKFISASNLNQYIDSSFESENDHKRILSTLATQKIEIQSSIVLDYKTRVPDLKGANFLYTLLILDLWWIDMIGPWEVKHTLQFTVKDSKTEKAILSTPEIQNTQITRRLTLKSVDEQSLATSIENSTKEMILEYAGVKK
ncbi:MAG: hypothetical protein SFU98_07235 [Leptospiraceae bacterium]|nr:hypothetical protein [Leptospiraceae bacterium]